jgi:DNA-binding GntR family transcriptional regulator
MTLAQTIVSNLRYAIISGEYKPGQHLKEEDICKRWNVSRTPVREALKQLEAENLIKISPNVGARVVDLSIKDVSDIYDMLIVLEATACRLACLQISTEQVNKLEEYQFMMDKAAGVDNIDLVFELNIQFHWLITESTRNPYLIEIRKNYRSLVDRFARLSPSIPGQLKATLDEHPGIIDAIRKRNPALAEFVMKGHMENAKKFLISYLRALQSEKDVSGNIKYHFNMKANKSTQ